jgi:PAS domain S-box-containing protein
MYKTSLTLPPTAAELRRRAEERLRELHPGTGPAQTDADTQRLVHELQVHQIELEMQNEELQKARDQMEAGLEKYSDLYDFAPVGFLTLDREGTIREANLTSASLLGIERSRLVKRRFGLCVSPADLPAFNAFLTRVFESKVRESCEVTLINEGSPPVEVRIEAAAAASGRECRAVLEDITRHKRAEEDRLILNRLESTEILAGEIGRAHV